MSGGTPTDGTDPNGGTLPGDARDARSGMTARVTTTVVLPPDALTVVVQQTEMISQINVERVLGIPARVYLEVLRERGCPLSVTNLGKLRLVDRGDFRSWLKARGKAKRAAAAAAIGTAPDDDDALTVEEQVRLGIKPAPPPAGRS